MIMERRLYKAVAILLVAGAISASCSGDDKGPDTPSVTPPTAISIDRTSIDVAKEGGKVSFTVTSPSKPTTSSDASWVKVTDSGTYSDYKATVSVSVSENTGYDSRTATLTVISGALKATVSVIQAGKDKPSLSSDTETLSFSSWEGDYSFTVTAPSKPEVSSTASWMKASSTDPDASFISTLTVSVEKNDGAERYADLKVSAGGKTLVIPVTQAKAASSGDYSQSLVTPGAIGNATRLYEYFLSIYGEKTVSGAMANVNWNQDEADWIAKWTGYYPAFNTFDYIHLPFSPANWIDYSDLSPAVKYVSAGGFIAAGWHWNVPKSKGSKDYTCTTSETSFLPSNIMKSGTWENELAQEDLQKITSYLLLLQDKGISVLWRPLHEAAGSIYVNSDWGNAWFWWGREGAETFKALWRYVFDYFREAGLKNLIWVWTTQSSSASDCDSEFYPGDDYVDIIGRDIYNVSSASECASQFSFISSAFPGKMVALSECGNVPDMASQWNAGARWLYFMPWYDYGNNGTENYAHGHANISWWKSSYACPSVVKRDDLPSDLFSK